MIEPPEAHPRFGIEFDWFARDSNDHVALFITDGHGPVPGVLLALTDQVDAAADTLKTLPGIYTYEWQGYHGPYQRITKAPTPVSRLELPPTIQQLAALVRFSVAFAATTRFDLPWEQPAAAFMLDNP